MHIIRDTSERASVERLHSDLAAIVESSDDAIIGLSSEGTITSWNVGAEKIFGYSRDEAIGESIGGLTPPGRGDEETDILLQLGRGNGAYHAETVRIGKTGTPIDLSVTISPIRTADNRILGASVIARDIRDRKATEETLTRLARFPDENPHPNPPDRSRRAPRVCEPGQSRAPDRGAAPRRCAGAPALRQAAAEALRTRQSCTIEVEHDGRMISLFVAPLVEAGYANLYGRDVTERRRAEQALRASEERLRTVTDTSRSPEVHARRRPGHRADPELRTR